MATDSRLRWVIRDVIPGNVAIGGSDGLGDTLATVRATATVINGCGGSSQVESVISGEIDENGNAEETVSLLLRNAILGARRAAQAFCDTANAEVEAGNQGDHNSLGAELAMASKEERVAKLRSMSDQAVIEHAVRGGTAIGPEASDLVVLTAGILRVLREAGFSREEPKQAIEFIFPEGQHIQIYGDRASLGAVKAHLCDAFPGMKYSKGA